MRYNDLHIEQHESININYLSYFFPIEVKHLKELDEKLKKIRITANKYQRLRGSYHSIFKEYNSFNINPMSWRAVLDIPFYYENSCFRSLNLQIFRESEHYLIIKVTLRISDLFKLQTWLKLRTKYNKRTISNKDGSKIIKPIHIVQEEDFMEYFRSLENIGEKKILEYFSDLLFYPYEYHIPCIRTFKINTDKNFETLSNSTFWKSIGLHNFHSNLYKSDCSVYYLSQNYKENHINIYIDCKVEKADHETFEDFTFGLFPSIGVTMSISEVYNLIYKKYREMENTVGIFSESEKLIELNKLLHYIKIFDIRSVIDSEFFNERIEFRNVHKYKRTESLHQNIKDVMLTKTNALSQIYDKETTTLSNLLNLKLSKNNYRIQLILIIFTSLSLILTTLAFTL